MLICIKKWFSLTRKFFNYYLGINQPNNFIGPQKYSPYEYSGLSVEIGLVECVTYDDAYISKLLKSLENKNINPDRIQIYGVWNYIGLHGVFNNNYLSDFFGLILGTNIEYKRWSDIYGQLGVAGLIKVDEISQLDKISLLVRALKDYLKILRKKSLLDLKLNKIPVGDLIYSSYVRFRERKTIEYRDLFILFLIFKLLCIDRNLTVLLKRQRINFYITSYTSYIQHGYISRYFINAGVNVYSLGNIREIAKYHPKGDYAHRFRSWEFLRDLDRRSDISINRIKAANELERRFSGNNDLALSYMKTSSYLGEALPSAKNFDGVVFLHDFFDGPSDNGFYLFDDIYSWADHTLGIIEKFGLKIAIKPHPNQSEASLKILKILKEKYPNVSWINANTSNLSIMQEVVGGISIFGSILYELGYFEKVAISAGDHPGSDFGFAYQPKSIAQYDNMLMKLRSMTPIAKSKEKVIDFYVAQNFLVSNLDVEI